MFTRAMHVETVPVVIQCYSDLRCEVEFVSGCWRADNSDEGHGTSDSVQFLQHTKSSFEDLILVYFSPNPLSFSN